MGKIVVSANVSLDGVTQDPDGQEGFKHGGWFKQFVGNDLEAWAKNETEETLRAEVMVLGRKSDEWFATRTPGRTEPWAERMNGLPKYVVSSTLEKPLWTNAAVVKDVEEVSRLKQETRGEILIYGSYQLVRTLIEHRLVDEFRLLVFPVVVGSGERLFRETTDKTPLRLVRSQTIGEGLLLVTYEVVRAASH
ncbi:MAG TPA: dihydrofolate reductase family protein [Aliidongia sp.]|uniref:dihydrofolate reductase family protein n=1 Tax=Aliidongia sp. TaxID=1914230 RepID=UPI002DDCFBC6|nr:dihydrofolate reductase family protein [Aliidongia sp.]HEV2678709.1 dihydrofolate reductase family protein [Aliidongia sp.]